MARYGHSTSSTSVSLGVWKPVWNLLFIFHCNCVSFFYRFRNITIYWSKICGLFCRFYPTQLRLKPSPEVRYDTDTDVIRGVPLLFRIWKLVLEKRNCLDYPTVNTAWSWSWASIFTWYRSVTDSRTWPSRALAQLSTTKMTDLYLTNLHL